MFSKNLKQIRIEKGISTSQIAEHLGITQTSYNKYENGLREPNLSTFKMICQFLNVSSDELLDL